MTANFPVSRLEKTMSLEEALAILASAVYCLNNQIWLHKFLKGN